MMKKFTKTLMLASATLALASVGSAATILSVGATQAYGTPTFGSHTTATWTSLSSLGGLLGITITPGTTSLNFTAVGSICYNPGASACPSNGSGDVAVSGITNPIVGGFVSGISGSTTFISSGLGGINTSGDWTSDFSNDFVVTSAGTGNVVVPVGTTFVVFAFRDSYYNDNFDFGSDLGVSVDGANPSAVPEPATYAMMLAGLGAVAAFKRLRRS
jgi:PEP-CTERM motif